MKLYKIENKKIIKSDIKNCWDFFSDPLNLEKLTPGNMFFKINLKEKRSVYPGMLIDYSIKPILNLKFKWITEITAVEKNKYFIDEQRFGPYKFWHHQHFFNETDEGTEITDEVKYILPFGIFGQLIHPLIVKPKLDEIFKYRNIQIDKIFNYGK